MLSVDNIFLIFLVIAMEGQIHGNEVMKMMLELDKALSRDELEHQIGVTFGKEARFYTCSAEGMTASELIDFLEAKGKEVTATTDGRKCVEAYKRKNIEHSKNYFDVVILDQKMPIMTGLQAAAEILNINSQQRIIFASGYLEKTLLDILTRLNRAIAVIEKPFSLDVLDYMINNSEFFKKLEKININQEEKDIKQKMSEVMTVLQNPI